MIGARRSLRYEVMTSGVVTEVHDNDEPRWEHAGGDYLGAFGHATAERGGAHGSGCADGGGECLGSTTAAAVRAAGRRRDVPGGAQRARSCGGGRDVRGPARAAG